MMMEMIYTQQLVRTAQTQNFRILFQLIKKKLKAIHFFCLGLI